MRQMSSAVLRGPARSSGARRGLKQRFSCTKTAEHFLVQLGLPGAERRGGGVRAPSSARQSAHLGRTRPKALDLFGRPVVTCPPEHEWRMELGPSSRRRPA